MSVRRAAATQPLLFLAAGVANTAFGYAAFGGFILMGAPSAVAVIGSTLLGILFNFRSLGMVFGGGTPDRLPRFLAVYAFLTLANLAALHGLLATGLPAMAAQAVVVPVLALLSFFLMRRVVFAARTRET